MQQLHAIDPPKLRCLSCPQHNKTTKKGRDGLTKILMVVAEQSHSVLEQLFYTLLMEELTIVELFELIVMVLLLQVEFTKGLIDMSKRFSMRICRT